LITRLESLKTLPYRLYVAILLKDETKLDKADEMGVEGYSIITKHPKMVMLFLEYTDGVGTKIGKDVWNLL
jgi:hypothetical protein